MCCPPARGVRLLSGAPCQAQTQCRLSHPTAVTRCGTCPATWCQLHACEWVKPLRICARCAQGRNAAGSQLPGAAAAAAGGAAGRAVPLGPGGLLQKSFVAKQCCGTSAASWQAVPRGDCSYVNLSWGSPLCACLALSAEEVQCKYTGVLVVVCDPPPGCRPSRGC